MKDARQVFSLKLFQFDLWTSRPMATYSKNNRGGHGEHENSERVLNKNKIDHFSVKTRKKKHKISESKSIGAQRNWSSPCQGPLCSQSPRGRCKVCLYSPRFLFKGKKNISTPTAFTIFHQTRQFHKARAQLLALLVKATVKKKEI